MKYFDTRHSTLDTRHSTLDTPMKYFIRLLGAFLVLFNFLLVNHAFAVAPGIAGSNRVQSGPQPWESECVDLQKKHEESCNSCSCQSTEAKSFNTINQLMQSPAWQQQMEREFLWNFLADQYKQTQCKNSILAPYDLSPDDGTLCGNDEGLVDPKASFEVGLCKANPDSPLCTSASGKKVVKVVPVSQDAKNRQNKIIDQIWKLHSFLIKETNDCSYWTNALEGLNHPTVYTKNNVIIRNEDKIAEAKKQQNFHCGEKLAITSKIWSGSTPEMQTFLNSWINKFQKENITEAQFRATAIPVDSNNRMREEKSDLTLEGAVWKMSCATRRREQVLRGAMNFDKNGNATEPKSGSNDTSNPLGRQVFNALLSDNGQAASAYLANSKYHGISEALSCHLLKKYSSEPEHRQSVKILEGGAVFLVGIAATPIVGPEAAMFGTATAAAIVESHQSCKKSFKPGTLEVAPVCDQIRGHENDVGFVTSILDQGQGCMASIESGVLTVAAAGLGGEAVGEALGIKNALEEGVILKSSVKKAVEKATADETLAAGTARPAMLSRTTSSAAEANSGAAVVRRVGSESITVDNKYGGEAFEHYFSANAEPEPAGLNPYRKMGPGDTFESPDGKTWTFESKNDAGEITFSSGSEKLTWKSGEYNARDYGFHIKLPYERDPHVIHVTIPTLPNGSADEKMLADIKGIVADLPSEQIKTLDNIVVHNGANKFDKHWEETYKMANFKSGATGGDGVINLFPAGKSDNMLGIFRHELGHDIASGRYGTTMPDAIWQRAMSLDGKAVSTYATKSNAEDFAETVEFYLRTEAGTTKESIFQRSNYAQYKERFKILDEFFNTHPDDKRQLVQLMKNIKRVTAASGAAGGTYILVQGEIKLINYFKNK